MSFQEIYDKLVKIEKKLESFEELKPMILSNDNLCGKCVGDLLYLTRQEIRNKMSIQAPQTENEPEDQEPLDVPDEVSQIDETNIPATEEDNSNEDSDADDNDNNIENGSSVSLHDHDSEHVKRGMKKILYKLTSNENKDSGKTLLHLIQALNAKLYFDKVRNSRRNLSNQLPTFDEIKRTNISYEPNTSMLGFCTSSSADTMQDAPTAEEVFAIYPELDDDENKDPSIASAVKDHCGFEESGEDFFTSAMSDTLNSENFGDDDDIYNDTIFLADDEENNNI